MFSCSVNEGRLLCGEKKAKKCVGKGLEIPALSVFEFAKYSPLF